MIAIIFEVFPHPDRKAQYLDIAAGLRSDLEKIDGFISVERFQSLTNPKKLLSISFYENEEAVTAWRNLASHRRAQAMGRSEVFSNYRLRVLSVMRDYGMFDRDQTPVDSVEHHDQSSSDARP